MLVLREEEEFKNEPLCDVIEEEDVELTRDMRCLMMSLTAVKVEGASRGFTSEVEKKVFPMTGYVVVLYGPMKFLLSPETGRSKNIH